MLASKKVSLKNQNFFWLFWSEKLVEAILWVFKNKLSIFYILILVDLGLNLNLATNSRVIILILLPEFIKTCVSTSFF